jgi:hypothetical protein
VVLRTPTCWRYSVTQTPGAMTTDRISLDGNATFESFELALREQLVNRWGLVGELVWSAVDVDLWRADFDVRQQAAAVIDIRELRMLVR